MQKVVHLLRSARFIEYRKLQYLLPIFLTAIITLFNQQVKGQDLSSKKVMLNLKGVPVKEALMTVQKQSGITFVFSEDIKKYTAAKVTLTEKNITVKQAIELILKTTNLKYTQVDDQVVIDEKPAQKSPNALAGGGPGTLKGRIVEFETSQPLPGATVYLVELQKGMQSNMDGYYSFVNVPAGKYTLQVSFIGYTAQKVDAEVKAGKEQTYDVKLQGNNNLKEVVVKGTGKTRKPVAHTSERQVLEQIKSAQSVVSGISSELISKSADRNVAEAVKRISGVTIKDDKFMIVRGMNERYNLTYLNGNMAPSTEEFSRSFDLSLLPTRIIDRILVYKSPAPDLFADMAGGAVKIFTKDAKNVKHFDIELQTGYREGTTFNKNFLSYQGSGTDFLGFDNGLRKLPSAVPGYGSFASANISQATYAKSFSSILNYGKTSAAPPLQLTANYYNSYQLFGKDLSTLTSVSYKNEPQHSDLDRAQGTYLVALGQGNGDIEGSHVKKAGAEDQNNETSQLSLLQNFTWHPTDSSTVYFKNFLLQQGQKSTIVRNFRNDEILKADGSLADNNPGSEIPTRDIILSWQQRLLYSGNLGGSFYTGKKAKGTLDYNVGYTYSRLSTPDQRVIHLQNNAAFILPGRGLNEAGDEDENWTAVSRDQNGTSSGTYSTNKLDQGMISRTWTLNTEATYNGSLDYTYKWKPWITIKLGTYQLWKQREVFRRVYTINEGDLPSSGEPDPLNPLLGATSPIDYNIVYFRQQDLNKVWSNTYLREDGTGLKVFDRTSGADAYIATEQNNSGYIAASLLPFGGKLDIYGGVRVEYDRRKVASAISGSVNTPILTDLKKTVYLPSLNIGYRPDSSFVLRGSFGKTVNRPEFVEISPYQNFDYANNQTIVGNPGIISADINNYDLRLEFYPKANKNGETFSLGAFYKTLTNPIERVLYNNLDPYAGAAPTRITFQNTPKAEVKGIELDIIKNLDFLPGNFFRKLSVVANGTLIRSRVDSVRSIVSNGAVPVSRNLQGQAPYVINAGLYYDNAGSGTKVGLIFNQVGPSIYAAATGGTLDTAKTTGGSQVYQASLLQLTRRQLDFSLTQRLIKSLQLKFSIQNLLNNAVQLAEDANYSYKYEKVAVIHYTIDNSPTFYKYSGDPVYSSYKPGRFYVLNLTYSF